MSYILFYLYIWLPNNTVSIWMCKFPGRILLFDWIRTGCLVTLYQKNIITCSSGCIYRICLNWCEWAGEWKTRITMTNNKLMNKKSQWMEYFADTAVADMYACASCYWVRRCVRGLDCLASSYATIVDILLQLMGVVGGIKPHLHGGLLNRVEYNPCLL